MEEGAEDGCEKGDERGGGSCLCWSFRDGLVKDGREGSWEVCLKISYESIMSHQYSLNVKHGPRNHSELSIVEFQIVFYRKRSE